MVLLLSHVSVFPDCWLEPPGFCCVLEGLFVLDGLYEFELLEDVFLFDVVVTFLLVATVSVILSPLATSVPDEMF